MTHRRYAPLPPTKPQPIDKPVLRNNEARLKNIYQAQLVFKDKPKEPYFKKSLNKSTQHKQIEELPQPKFKTPVHQLNLAQIKQSQRYKEERESQNRQSVHIYKSYDNSKGRYRYAKQSVALTSRLRDQSTSRQKDDIITDRSENYKIRRKSISGSLKKKLKEQQNAQYLSANPVIPSELNYYEEARKLYKDGKMSEALRLFQLIIQKDSAMVDAYYYASLCHLSKHQYQKAFDLLNSILEKFQNYKRKTVYLFAGISSNHVNQVEKAMSLITQGISHYPDYTDLYLYRAKLLQEQSNFEEALSDYEVVLKTKKQNPEVLFKMGLCYKSLGKMSNCLSMLNSALYYEHNDDHKCAILIERIKINFQDKKFKECKKDLQKLEEIDPQSCEMNYYKGLLQLGEQNKKGALLSFQKCIRSNSNSQAVAKALVQISKSKIEDRDFYSALYHISRASYMGVSSEDIEKFKLFCEGVVFLMKRKINEGVKNLNELKEKYILGQYFDKLFYLYRAFGYFMQNQHQKAIEDYITAQKFAPKDKHITYNQLIAEGIVRVNNKQFQQALKKFDQAQNVISLDNLNPKIEPFIYRAMTFAEKTKTNLHLNQSDDLQTLEELFIALKELDKAYDVNDSNSNMLYLRSLIYMYLGKTDDGLQDIIKAISKSEQNVAKYFFFRALAHETLGNSKQALNDFNICINLDQKYEKAYFQRCKLFFSNEQPSKGLEDLKKYSELNVDSDSKVHECCLFYIAKEYDLAQNCLEQITDDSKKRQLQVFIDFKQLRITEVKSKLIGKADQMICDIMMGDWNADESTTDDLVFFNRMQYHCYMGIKYFNTGFFEEAINQFSIAVKEKTLMDFQQNQQNNAQQESPQSEDLLEIPIDIETKQNQLHYLNYNIFLSYLANGEQKKAYETFVRDILPAKESFLRSQTVGTMSRLLFQTLKTSESLISSQKEVFQFIIFRSMIGQSSDYLNIELPNIILKTKLCYPMPYAKQIYQDYSAKINPSFMLQCLKISEVENKPEPPWVRRKNQDLIFTDDVRNINVQFQTTQHDEEEQQDEYDDQEEEGEEEEDPARENGEETEEAIFDPRKFKEQMRLDDDIERKLKKIMEGKQKKTE